MKQHTLPKPSTLEKFTDVPDLVRDDKSGVMVSAGGRDKGTIVKGALIHQTIPGDVQYEDHKRPQPVARVVDALILLHRAETITDEAYVAGKRFQDAFDRAALETMPSMRLDGLPGGLIQGAADRSQPVVDARTEVFAAMNALGGFNTSCGIAAEWIIGKRWSIRQIAEREHVKRTHVWTGVVIGTLDILKAFYQERDERRRGH